MSSDISGPVLPTPPSADPVPIILDESYVSWDDGKTWHHEEVVSDEPM